MMKLLLILLLFFSIYRIGTSLKISKIIKKNNKTKKYIDAEFEEIE